MFCLLEFTENSKKRKYESSGVRCLKSYFGTNWLIFYSHFIHALIWIVWFLYKHVIVSNNDFYVWLGIIISQFPEKEFRENLGSILDFPGIPNLSEF